MRMDENQLPDVLFPIMTTKSLKIELVLYFSNILMLNLTRFFEGNQFSCWRKKLFQFNLFYHNFMHYVSNGDIVDHSGCVIYERTEHFLDLQLMITLESIQFRWKTAFKINHANWMETTKRNVQCDMFWILKKKKSNKYTKTISFNTSFFWLYIDNFFEFF